MRLKILVSVTLSLILGYGFFWYYMAGELEDRIEDWVKTAKSRGISVRYAELEINGFPYRMELAFTKLNVIRTERSRKTLRLTSPHVTYIAFPWKINHGVILAKGGTVRIGSRLTPQLSMDFGKSRGSVMVDRANGEFQRTSWVMEDLIWHDGAGGASEVKIHILRPGQAEQRDDMELPVQMKLYLAAENLILPDLFDGTAGQVKIDLALHGKEWPAYTKDGLANWRDHGGTLAVRIFSVLSGPMALDLEGEAALDENLKPLGAFSAKIRGIAHMSHLFPPLAGADVLEGKGDTLDLPISLQGGQLYLGPVPVYALPPVVE